MIDPKKNQEILERALMTFIREDRIHINYKESTLTKDGKVALDVDDVAVKRIIIPYSYYEEVKRKVNGNNGNNRLSKRV